MEKESLIWIKLKKITEIENERYVVKLKVKE
jgi:hypothetical protein